MLRRLYMIAFTISLLSFALTMLVAWPYLLEIAVALFAGDFRLSDVPGILVWCLVSGVMCFIFARLAARTKPIEDWRLERGLCTACGYDLRENESGRCPECGTKFGRRKRPKETGTQRRR